MTPTPEQLAMARMIYADYLISKTPGATQDDAPQFDDSAHGVQIALAAIIETTEAAAKYLETVATKRSDHMKIATLRANEHLKGRT